MDVLVIDGATVRELLPMADCIEVVESALAALAAGHGQQPVRHSVTTLNRTGVLALMPAELTNPALFGYKAVTVFPGNHRLGQPSHQAMVVLVDAETGRTQALVEGTEVTAIRTAAVSAAATRHLARADVTQLAILGAGVQARAHLRSIPAVRQIERVTIWSRRRSEAEKLADEAGTATDRGGSRFRVEVADSVAEACHDADVIVTATSAREPILALDQVRAGVHINAVGACFPDTRELGGELVASAAIFVDDLAAARVEAGDLLLAERDGLIGPDHVRGMLGDVFRRAIPGRTRAAEITIFESLGLGIEDVAVADVIRRRAVERGLGQTVTF